VRLRRGGGEGAVNQEALQKEFAYIFTLLSAMRAQNEVIYAKLKEAETILARGASVADRGETNPSKSGGL